MLRFKLINKEELIDSTKKIFAFAAVKFLNTEGYVHFFKVEVKCKLRTNVDFHNLKNGKSDGQNK